MAAHYLYNNLNKPGHFSLQHKGLVIARPQVIIMREVSFTVSEPSRQRVLTKQVRNVHAKAKFNTYSIEDCEQACREMGGFREISYNPYKQGSFYYCDTGESVEKVDALIGIKGKVYELL